MSAAFDLSRAVWEKSSYSNGEGGNCVEFARTFAADAGVVPVRDSKRPEGAALVVPAAAWQAFVDTVTAS
ncbi:DUF397 domain-containing protein [Streptomyces litchfieldiae]|uniref:DUF397 domain-containing protein n=1 Tax=Streptomyces litchfieldiae TaxID=3075543 RepID=A0ABU2MSE4_9ACTN|nr:DUF397 domain-containing protein [Streptomyces sp. DSM 44938]MDT0344552.1 DUF397 domain-containing protein [Streptomyces sp. DSM 44938]